MGIDEILALLEKGAELANNLLAAKKAGDQQAFNAAWIANQQHIAESNLAWVMAGDPPKIS